MKRHIFPAISIRTLLGLAFGLTMIWNVSAQSEELPAIPGLHVIQPNPNSSPSNYFAVLMSGDGGWRNFDQHISAELASKGVPVLGINSLHYLRKQKSPERAAADITRLIEQGCSRFGKQQVILIGYSCGANIIPFAYNRMNADTKGKVSYLALLSPEEKADFKFHFYNWMNANSAKARAVKPELLQLQDKPALFLFGSKEKKDWCQDLMADPFHLQTLPGGHHFGNDTARVTDEIVHFGQYD